MSHIDTNVPDDVPGAPLSDVTPLTPYLPFLEAPQLPDSAPAWEREWWERWKKRNERQPFRLPDSTKKV